MIDKHYTQRHNSFVARKQNHELRSQQSQPLHSLSTVSLISLIERLHTQRCGTEVMTTLS